MNQEEWLLNDIFVGIYRAVDSYLHDTVSIESRDQRIKAVYFGLRHDQEFQTKVHDLNGYLMDYILNHKWRN